ncbi:MAG: minor capsid protein [Firmicutes bacterium]|jgi:SPP1 gp7 family putative phage head morphogenesis protein|nr:minor capsid protein [Bacillota bacterium]
MNNKNKYLPVWKTSKRLERNYERILNVIQQQFFQAISNQNNPNEMINLLNIIARQYSFEKYCQEIALQMVTSVYKKTEGNWRKAAGQNSKGHEIYEALNKQKQNIFMQNVIQKLIEQNATLIKTLPFNIASDITKYIEKETTKGRRAEDLAEEIKIKFTEKTKANAMCIARTEVSKAQSALIRTRAEILNIQWYIWRTSQDERVRNSHKDMEGVLVSWKDPPSPEQLSKSKYQYGKYHAGEIFNCRCYAEPIVDIRFVKFPCKVYCNGRMIKMKKSEFLKIM